MEKAKTLTSTPDVEAASPGRPPQPRLGALKAPFKPVEELLRDLDVRIVRRDIEEGEPIGEQGRCF